MSDVVRNLVRCRNHLISEWRSEEHGQTGTKRRLDAINAILSVAVGAQHPIVGVKPKRIALARDALRAFLDEARPPA